MKIKFILTIFFLIFNYSNIYSKNIKTNTSIFTGKVKFVFGGDSFILKCSNGNQDIRLYGIDAPEKKQPYYKASKKILKILCYKKNIKIKYIDIDKYDRIVGIAYINDICINEEMIKKGFAWIFVRFCKEPYYSKWMKFQKEAKKNRLGLWNDKNPTPPWIFREENKKQ